MSEKNKNEGFFTRKKYFAFEDESKAHFLPELDDVQNSIEDNKNEFFEHMDNYLERDEFNRIKKFVIVACEALEKEIIIFKKPNTSKTLKVFLRPEDILCILMDFHASVNGGNFKNVQLSKK